MTSSWNDSYAIGLNVVDGQHKRLIAYFDELKNEMKKGVDINTIQITLNNLKMYGVRHFATEERLMEQTDYPQILTHKAEHRFFLEKVLEFEQQVSENNRGVCVDMLQFLNTWILNHIKTVDNKMMPFLDENGVTNLNSYTSATI